MVPVSYAGSRSVRIGLDGSCWVNRRGFGRFTRSLLTEMIRLGEHRYVIVIDGPSLQEAELPPHTEVVAVKVDRPQSEAASATSRRSVRDLARMSLAARRARCDAFYFPATYSYYPVVGVPTVVTVHDAIAEKSPHLVFSSRQARLFWALKQQISLRRAAAVVTVSQSAQDDIAGWLGVAKDRITVIREAPDRKFHPRAGGDRSGALDRLALSPEDRYLLYVGGISPHKNLEVLIRAFQLVAESHPDVRLLLVGDTTHDPFLSSTGSIQQLLATTAAGRRVTLTGYLADDDLVSLYGGAVASALPSLGEGFGLTAAESAACGTPVVASDIPALVELLGDTALYAPPDDPAAFAGAFSRLLDDPGLRAELSHASLDRAAGWSWKAAAETVVGLLEQVGSGRD